MCGLNQILKSQEVQMFSGSNAELFAFVKMQAKANIGHGISQEYFDTHFCFGGLINQSNIGGMVKNAKYNRGSFSSKRMKAGCIKYWQRKKESKESEE